MVRKFRFMVNGNRRSPDGKPVLSFGIRVGWWPCLKAPFVSIGVGPVALDFWHGLPSYRKKADEPSQR